jgi:hypothetical protein
MKIMQIKKVMALRGVFILTGANVAIKPPDENHPEEASTHKYIYIINYLKKSITNTKMFIQLVTHGCFP